MFYDLLPNAQKKNYIMAFEFFFHDIDNINNHSGVGRERYSINHGLRILKIIFLGCTSIEGANSRYYLNGLK